MISSTLASRLWPGQSAVGKQLVVDYSTAGTYPYEIVGVIGDLRFADHGANRCRRSTCHTRNART